MTFAKRYDAYLFDLDGTVWEGGQALPHAQEAITSTKVACYYITNNASRSPETVAGMLSDIAIPTKAEQVLTSSQAAVEMLAETLEPGAKVLILGAPALRDLATAAGFEVVDSADTQPAAVLQGHNPETGWAQLSEAALAIRAGARFFATNLDSSLPTERGLCVGNGSMVKAVEHATGVVPQAAGKPEPTMFHAAAKRAKASNALGIGDRLDTDIAGGVAAGMDSLHVLTGVSLEGDLIYAEPLQRPTYVATDLRCLEDEVAKYRPHPEGGFSASWEGSDIVLTGGDVDATALDALHTVLACAWEGEAFDGKVRAEGEAAVAALAQFAHMPAS
ncbi:MAG: HAD-IIA family hydrolase [Corynebacterium sp.]|nr:HAD-IIA family hydrolase [Corynebacterium sp.]